MSVIGRGGKPFQLTLVNIPVSRQSCIDERHSAKFKQIHHSGGQDVVNEFLPSHFSPAIPIASSVLRGLDASGAEMAWRGDEQRWQCRLVSGSCAGLLIDVLRTSTEAMHITLTPPDEALYDHLLLILTEIKQRLSVFGDIDIKVRHVHEK